MSGIEALARLQRLRVPAVRTADAAAALGQSKYAASKTLSRLAEAGLVHRVRHGLFWLEGPIDPLRLPELLTEPFPAYVSLQTALQLRGVIQQIPAIVYAVSLARTRRIVTSVGTVSIHRVVPALFGGFEETRGGARVASAEKALFDLAYLSTGRSRRFATAPELELPRGFRRRELDRWIARIDSHQRRTVVRGRLERWLSRAQ